MSFKILLDEINSNLTSVFKELEFPQVNFSVEPSKRGFGDVSCNAPFLLAKNLNKTPFEISQTIVEKYQRFLGELVSKIEAHPSGYLNFYANFKKLNGLIIKNSIKDDYGFVDLGKNSSVVIEHTSVNPNKALHIGHIRNIVIGDSLARILTKANYNVKVLNYVDDSGLQVADILVGFRELGFPENSPDGKKFDQYCGDVVYVKTTEKYSNNPELEDIRQKILQQLEDGDSEVAQHADVITKKVLACQLETCWNLSVTYDCLNFESQILRSGLWENIFEKLKEMKIIEFEKDGKNVGCWVIRGDGKEEDKVLVRSNGIATYIAKDIPYAAWKLGVFDDPFNYKKYNDEQPESRVLWQTILGESSEQKQNFTGEKVITVIDSRQSRLQKIISSIISKFTSNPDAYVHLAYESVTLSQDTAKHLGIDIQGKQTQMSGRKGLYVNADSVLELLKNKIKDETVKRNPDLDPKTISRISNEVAVGTIRYEMVKQDLDKIITFDLSKSLSLEGDTVPYIQYSYARASRILEKAKQNTDFTTSFEMLEGEYEKNLIKAIGLLELYVTDAAKNLSPKVIARYCYFLSVAFTAFYEHVKVLESGDQSLINERLCLVQSFKSTLKNGLNLIGIVAPERM